MKKIIVSIALITLFNMAAVEQKNILEAIFRKLVTIEDLSSIAVSKISNIQDITVLILEQIDGLSFSASDLICCSKIDAIVGKQQAIQSIVDELNLSAIDPICCSKIDVAISANDAVFSAVETISSSQLESPCCSNIDQIVSKNDQILSAIDTIHLTALDLPCCSKIEVLIDTETRILSILDALSMTTIDVPCCSKIDAISSHQDRIMSLIDGLNQLSFDIACCSKIEALADTEAHLVSRIDSLNVSALDVACCSKIEQLADTEAHLVSKIDSLNVSALDVACCSKIEALADTEAHMVSRIESLNFSAVDVPCCTRVEALATEQEVLLGMIDSLNLSASACAATPISTSTTISTPGYYCLANDIVGDLIITASNVVLDLNSHAVSFITNDIGSFSFVPIDQVTVRNGVVDGTLGIIFVESTNIILEDLVVKNGTNIITASGIYLQSVLNAAIKNVQLVNNTNGLTLDSCGNVMVTDCIAQGNTQRGFDLVSSYTCVFTDCKALSTGRNNIATANNNVLGFVSRAGYGNIFERCIANSTQALFTVDSNSVVAGFALLGTEQSSKIINCESANSGTSANGFTVPYGIFLESTISSVPSITGALDQAVNSFVYSVNWSPDGQYLAVGGLGLVTNGNELQVFRFDRSTSSLSYITGALDQAVNDYVYSVNWSSDGQYLAVGGGGLVTNGNDLQVFRFDRSSGVLQYISGALDQAVNIAVFSVNWSPDGQYLAVGGVNLVTNSNDLQIYRFDRVSGVLQYITGALNQAVNGVVFSVNWSPDGQYLAVGGGGLVTNGNELQVFRFDRVSGGALLYITGALDRTINSGVASVNWSPDGQYLAVGGSGLVTNGNDLQIYRFDRSTSSLSYITGALDQAVNGFINSVNWSPDGQYLAVGGSSLVTNGNELQVFRFDRSTSSLSYITGALDQAVNGYVSLVNWSPDGQCLAVGGQTLVTNGNDLQLFGGLEFPQHNVITGNTVYCNSGAMFPSGVGISGPSICNEIIGNNAYSNPISRGMNAPIVASNYQFVCNVFNQLFGPGPTTLQNIALGSCEPIANQIDQVAFVKRNKYLLASAIDMLVGFI